MNKALFVKASARRGNERAHNRKIPKNKGLHEKTEKKKELGGGPAPTTESAKKTWLTSRWGPKKKRVVRWKPTWTPKQGEKGSAQKILWKKDTGHQSREVTDLVIPKKKLYNPRWGKGNNGGSPGAKKRWRQNRGWNERAGKSWQKDWKVESNEAIGSKRGGEENGEGKKTQRVLKGRKTLKESKKKPPGREKGTPKEHYPPVSQSNKRGAEKNDAGPK